MAISRLQWIIPLTAYFALLASKTQAQQINLVKNPTFENKSSDGNPTAYTLQGNVEYRYLGDPTRDVSGMGIAFQSAGPGDPTGSVSQKITNIDSQKGRWFRFTFRGLPQDHFIVAQDDLRIRVEFFGQGGKISYDAKGQSIWPIIQQERKDFTVNGVHHVGGAAVWRTYQLDFYLPFPQVDTVNLIVSFAHGQADRPLASEFFITDFSLIRLPDPTGPDTAQPADWQPQGTPILIAGRWFYDAPPGQTAIPDQFNSSNADRLLYKDSQWSAPFASQTSAYLRAGDKDLQGNIALIDRPILDNVTIRFDSTSMIIHTHGLPNHPTGKFPQFFGNPNYIQEQDETFYIPLTPRINPDHIATAKDNSNRALPMGPIGVAVNGVVFFNPFDANSQDATDLMDRCCGHPSPDNLYHYHKYPICMNSPWSDDGKEHSPLIGWAFDGFPIYGPYAAPNIMAKDITGDYALNDFNIHYDDQRGWHYQVTPGKFPYIIGGYWGYPDPRDITHRHPPRNGMGPPNGASPNGPGGFGPPADGMPPLPPP
jgi:hypothetical protein